MLKRLLECDPFETGSIALSLHQASERFNDHESIINIQW